ncbi:MAG: hypothetical protein ABI823_21635, partial [Bryobacteraceae bacterium]
MIQKLRVLAVLVVFACLLPAQDASQSVVGRWYTAERSRGGIGATVELKPDGRVLFSPGAIVEYGYSFDGQKLTLRFVDPAKGPMPDTVLTVKALSATDLTLEAVGAPAGQSINLTRVGAAEDG